MYNRLGKLTTITEANKSKTISQLYPTHYKQLKQAGLVHGKAPTLTQVNNLAKAKAHPNHKKSKQQQQRQRERKTFFCIGQSTAWTTPIHKVINRLKKALGLNWI